VLIIDESDPSSGVPTTFSTTLRSTLNNATPRVAVFDETLDFSHFSGPKQEAILRTYIRQKYGDVNFGVIVAVGAASFDLVTRWRSDLWPDVPVIFAAIDELTASGLKVDSNTTGLIMRRSIKSMMTSARILVPDLRGVAVLGGSLERDPYRLQYLRELPTLAAETELINLTGLPLAVQVMRAAALPDRTAILYTSLFIDDEGTRYSAPDALAEIARVANRPIVVDVESLVGLGATGGIVLSNVSYGKEAGALTLRILDGASVAANPIAVSEFTQPIFDWRQLERWGISESRLPPGSEIRFRSPTAWEQYRRQILATAALLLLQAVMIIALLYEHRRRRDSQIAAHELSGRLITAHEEERARLARELHDDVTQRLALLAIQAGREEGRLTGPAEVSAMRTMREGLARLSEDVHGLSYRLHPSILEDLGLIEALKSECRRFSQTCSTQLETSARDVPERLPQDVALCLFRIAQEGLRNIARHAGASRAEVRLQRLDGGLQLTVGDDGAGFDPAEHRIQASLGHAGMRQRVRLLDGKIEIESSPGQGTTIMAWVPLRQEDREPSARAAG
jgi:signal transduction histidine kinase